MKIYFALYNIRYDHLSAYTIMTLLSKKSELMLASSQVIMSNVVAQYFLSSPRKYMFTNEQNWTTQKLARNSISRFEMN